jgi:hypothetical protein
MVMGVMSNGEASRVAQGRASVKPPETCPVAAGNIKGEVTLEQQEGLLWTVRLGRQGASRYTNTSLQFIVHLHTWHLLFGMFCNLF